eukprot:IDg15430t1
MKATRYPNTAPRTCNNASAAIRRGAHAMAAGAEVLITDATIRPTSATDMNGNAGSTTLTNLGAAACTAPPTASGKITTCATDRSKAIGSIGIHEPANSKTSNGVRATESAVDVSVSSTEYATSAPANRHTMLEAAPPGQQPVSTTPSASAGGSASARAITAASAGIMPYCAAAPSSKRAGRCATRENSSGRIVSPIASMMAAKQGALYAGRNQANSAGRAIASAVAPATVTGSRAADAACGRARASSAVSSMSSDGAVAAVTQARGAGRQRRRARSDGARTHSDATRACASRRSVHGARNAPAFIASGRTDQLLCADAQAGLGYRGRCRDCTHPIACRNPARLSASAVNAALSYLYHEAKKHLKHFIIPHFRLRCRPPNTITNTIQTSRTQRPPLQRCARDGVYVEGDRAPLAGAHCQVRSAGSMGRPPRVC